MEWRYCVTLVSLAITWSIASTADPAIKNHKSERRQDSYLLYGGWTPMRTRARNSKLQTSATTHYHGMMSMLPHPYGNSMGAFQRPMSQQYHKDIYSYYPRPVIKSSPKKNTPVYMERARPQKQSQGYGGNQNYGPQIIDIQNIDLGNIQELQNILLEAKNLPMSHFNLPIGEGKGIELLELSLQSLPQQGNHNYGQNNNNNGAKAQRNNKGSKGRGHQMRMPISVEYENFRQRVPILPQTAPKTIEVAPINIPHGPSIENLLQNYQIIEVPVPGPIGYGNHGGGNYGNNNIRHSNYRQNTPHNGGQSSSFSYFAHQSQQPRQHYPAPEAKANRKPASLKHQDMAAELININESDLKHLLSNLQVLDKLPGDFLKYLSLDNIPKGKDDVVVVTLPDAVQNLGYESSKTTHHNNAYSHQEPAPQVAYPPKETAYAISSGGYQNERTPEVYAPADGYGHQGGTSKNTVSTYEHANYQTQEEHSGYEHVSYQPGGGYEAQYSRPVEETDNTHQSDYSQHEQTYIQVLTPHTDDKGYRREPVLAVEIQQGQSVEDAIKSLDRETLKKLGAHGEHGIEIEVVEVPVNEGYAAESKKVETVVPASGLVTRNSTIVTVKTRRPDAKKSS